MVNNYKIIREISSGTFSKVYECYNTKINRSFAIKSDESNLIKYEANIYNKLRDIGIIMDGNGRWAANKGLPRSFGHRKGAKNVSEIIKSCPKLGIKTLTLYAFSTENWKRPQKEIKFLFNLLENFLKDKIEDFNNQNIRLKIIGKKNFSSNLNGLLIKSEKKTIKNKRLQINLALNYGSKTELINAFKELKKNKENINEKNLKKYLETKNIPDPDLLIRTGNTKRLSNFLLWQIAYSEIFFEKKLWPDFNERDYNKIIKKFKSIKRNFGNI